MSNGRLKFLENGVDGGGSCNKLLTYSFVPVSNRMSNFPPPNNSPFVWQSRVRGKDGWALNTSVLCVTIWIYGILFVVYFSISQYISGSAWFIPFK